MHGDARTAVANFERGNALFLAGRLGEAVESYRQALRANPRLAPAHNNLGAALRELGRAGEAVEAYRASLALDRRVADTHANLGHALRDLGRAAEAVESYRTSIKLRGDVAEVHDCLGNALCDLGRSAEAVTCYRRAITLRPVFPEVYNNLGTALRDIGALAEAEASYRIALAQRPGIAAVHGNLGHVLMALGRVEEAVESFRTALRLTPLDVTAHLNLGAALRELRRFDEAGACFQAALRLDPKSWQALNNLSALLRDLRQFDHAARAARLALDFEPKSWQAWNNLAAALDESRHYESAAEAFERLLDLRPDFDFAPGFLAMCRRHACDWRHFEADRAVLEAGVAAGRRVAYPFVFLAVSDSPALQLACARIYAKARDPVAPTPLWNGTPYGHDRIRLAYLSADFHDHATAYLAAGLFEAHDRDRFDLTAISFGPPSTHPMRTRLESAFDRFIDVRDRTDAQVAEIIRDLEIDIAVDLKGNTRDTRSGILAYRPAPLQVNFLGYPGTMGAHYVDYIIADDIVIPEGEEGNYTEKVVRLPHSYQPNDRTRLIGPPPPRRDLGLPELGFIFCAFNSAYKITPPRVQSMDAYPQAGRGRCPLAARWRRDSSGKPTARSGAVRDRPGPAGLRGLGGCAGPSGADAGRGSVPR